MLSYRHGYHAGNFADVFKHVVLVACLEYLKRKPRPVSYIDTHAGAGRYALDSDFARKREEYADGIGRLWQRDGAPHSVARYLHHVAQANGGAEQLAHYPGSPLLASMVLADQDPMTLFELHPRDAEALAEVMAGRPRLQVRPEDGLLGCIGMLPPPSRRGLLLVDPSYEVKTDYQQVVTTLSHGYRRFATGVYALWYPVVERVRSEQLLAQLTATGIPRMECYEFGVAADSEAFGMTGCGMVLINPPFTLQGAMSEALPWLVQALAPDQGWWTHQVLNGE